MVNPDPTHDTFESVEFMMYLTEVKALVGRSLMVSQEERYCDYKCYICKRGKTLL
jgi:hypothetical protein